MLRLGKQLVCEPCSWIDCSISTEPPLEVLQISFTKGKPMISVVSISNKLPLLHGNVSVILTQKGSFPQRLSVSMQLLSVPLKQGGSW